jgi:hypothetical protein
MATVGAPTTVVGCPGPSVSRDNQAWPSGPEASRDRRRCGERYGDSHTTGRHATGRHARRDGDGSPIGVDPPSWTVNCAAGQATALSKRYLLSNAAGLR